MSSVPPSPPTPPPPPPPPPPGSFLPPGPAGPAGPGLPWDQRNQIGFVPALVETVKLFVMAPADAWARTRVKGDLVDPLLFAVILSWAGIIVMTVYNMMFRVSWLTYLPPAIQGRMGWALRPAGGGFFQMILAPIFIALGLFIGAAILHLCLMLVGGLSSSTTGFAGTFTVAAFSSVADLAHVIPVVGGLVAFAWKLVLVVLGIVALHRTTQGKAVAAVLIPVVFCCGCVLLLGVLGAAALFSSFHR